MNNPVNFLEIVASDIERAKEFYEKVLNLELFPNEMPEYKMYMFGSPDKIGASGAIIEDLFNKPSLDGTVPYFSSIDISVELKKVEALGGKILIDKTSIGEFGFFAHIIDSEGNRIGLHSFK
jgi:predicted enzyme related to lactoylglutathione lyase